MVLPENIDASYPDRSTGDRAHQQHHDEIHATINSLPDAPAGADEVALPILVPAILPPQVNLGFGGPSQSSIVYFSGYRQSDGLANRQVGWVVQLPPGIYTFTLIHRSGANRGIYQVDLGVQSLGSVDGYTTSDANIISEIAGIQWPGGRATMLLTMATKNASSAAFYGSVQAFAFTKTADL